MIYAMADLHGETERYRAMLERIHFSSEDTLYILGDVVDRGPEPMRVLLDMMERPNLVPLVGNHEWMAVSCLRTLTAEVTEQSIGTFKQDSTGLVHWWDQGGLTTMQSFYRLSKEDQRRVMAYLGEFEFYEELTAGGRQYILVHGGLGGFAPGRPLDDYSPDQLIWDRPDYDQVYFPDKYLVTGHTPTRLIPGNPRPGFIYRARNHIAIDCGCVFGGRLGAICLDTGEEFYTEG